MPDEYEIIKRKGRYSIIDKDTRKSIELKFKFPSLQEQHYIAENLLKDELIKSILSIHYEHAKEITRRYPYPSYAPHIKGNLNDKVIMLTLSIDRVIINLYESTRRCFENSLGDVTRFKEGIGDIKRIIEDITNRKD